MAGKLHEVVTYEHRNAWQQLQQQQQQKQGKSSKRRMSGSGNGSGGSGTTMTAASDDLLWQILAQLTRAKHQVTRTRWKTHDAMIEFSLAQAMQLAGSGSSIEEKGRYDFGKHQYLFENWRRRMQRTESLIKGIRDELARCLNMRFINSVQEGAQNDPDVAALYNDLLQRSQEASIIVKTKCLVDGEESQSDNDSDADDEGKHHKHQSKKKMQYSSATAAAATSIPYQPDMHDDTVHAEINLRQ